jgi:pilus assembly protein Flp/PilA
MGDGSRIDEAPPAGGAGGAVCDSELGQGLIKYAIIIFLVAIVVIAILLLLGPQIGAVFSSIYSTI